MADTQLSVDCPNCHEPITFNVTWSLGTLERKGDTLVAPLDAEIDYDSVTHVCAT